MASRVLIIVPTLGRRPTMLAITLASIVEQQVGADIAIVGPEDSADLRVIARDVDAVLLPDPGSQAAAINLGVRECGDGHHFVNWLGDDDWLTPTSLRDTVGVLDTYPRSVVAYGSCHYVDDTGLVLWTSKAGSWAPRLLSWGPDLVPQPGMLVRMSAWKEVGGVDESLRFAFDLDLLLKLKSQGSLIYTKTTVSCFRWHKDSLTVSDRTQSLQESVKVKRRYLGPIARRWSWTWELPVGIATRLAAARVNARGQHAMASNTRG